jgi:hypothetical protein
MMARKSFLLRMDPALLSALQRWAEQDLRSLNGQIEYLLRQAVVKQGMKIQESVEEPETSPSNSEQTSSSDQ